MANGTLQSLALALQQAAATGPVTLDETLFQTGNATPPDLTTLATAFSTAVSPPPPALQLTFSATDVGTPSGDTLQVTNAQLTAGFLGANPSDTNATITFTSLPDASPPNAVQIEIAVTLTNWTFTDAFPQMTGWPFDAFTIAGPQFTYSSDASVSPPLAAGMNFSGTAEPPQQFQPVAALISGLAGIPDSVQLGGTIDFSNVDNASIIYPDLDLKAPIGGTPPLMMVNAFQVDNPAIGFRIETSAGGIDSPPGSPLLPPLSPEQEGFVFLSASFEIENEVTLDFVINVGANNPTFTFDLDVDPGSPEQITPATVIGWLGGQSFLEDVPALLQQFLAAVELQGFAIVGTLPAQNSSFSVGTLSVTLGSVQGAPITLFGDPNNGASFIIESFAVDYTLSDPFGNPSSFTTITAEMAIPGVLPGTFELSIDSQFDISGEYDGTIDLSTLLETITGGAIGLPNGIDISFSDVAFNANPSQGTYAFNLTLDVDLDFITWNGDPILTFNHLAVAVSAATPAGAASPPGETVYSATIAGPVGIGPIQLLATVAYDGGTGVWNLSTTLSQPLLIDDLVGQFLADYDIPDFLSGLTIDTFGFAATLSSGASPVQPATWSVNGSLMWVLGTSFPGLPESVEATIGFQNDGQQTSGSIIASIELDAIAGAQVDVGYRFGPAAQDVADGAPGSNNTGDSTTLWISWEGFRAAYDITTSTLTFTVTGWSVGTLLQSLVEMIGFPNFALTPPWDFLNDISLDGLSVQFYLGSSPPGSQPLISATYMLPSPMDLGFIQINGITFQRWGPGNSGQPSVTLFIDGSSPISALQNSPLLSNQQTAAAAQSTPQGQDVTNMPSVPGLGTDLLDIQLLVLGQRVGIVGATTFDSVQDVIGALAAVPSSTGSRNPVNPGESTPGQPYYNPQNDWLIAANVLLLDGTFQIEVVFDDPDLYGLFLTFAGPKAKVLQGLAFEILYKKITDTIGVYQIDFTFPAGLRNINMGEFSITLPSISAQIYTNGDFLFDFGFPYNLDFSQSFTVSAIIAGIPVTGSAGFYFGKLSAATATNLPATTQGTFNPVIVFGFGAQIGLGYSITEGPLTAGFSVTVFGIIQGVIAPWHPYDDSGSGSGSDVVEGDYYYSLQGSFGLIGKLFGTINFAIISANVSVNITVVAQITFEAFRQIDMSISASVSVQVSLSINLGLFSITFHFSFGMTISESLTIGSNEQAPWDSDSSFQSVLWEARAIDPSGVAVLRPARAFAPLPRAADETAPQLSLLVSPQWTVLMANETDTNPADQEGAFIFLLAMDAPPADEAPPASPVTLTSFEMLCQVLLPWVIAGYVDGDTVTHKQMKAIVADLSANPIPIAELLPFLQTFSINVTTAATIDSGPGQAIQNGAVIFPPFPAMSVAFPAEAGTTTVQLDQYVTISPAYAAELAQYFAQIAAQVGSPGGQTSPPVLTTSPPSTPEPMAQFVFEDYFAIVARQLVQAAADSFDDYGYVLQPDDSIDSIIAWAAARGNIPASPPSPPHGSFKVKDITRPNVSVPLTTGNVLSIEGLIYTIQQQDSLVSIAADYSDAGSPARWTTTPLAIAQQNAGATNIVAAGITLPFFAITSPPLSPPLQYVTQPGQSLQSIADAVGVTLDDLVASVQSMTGFLIPTAAMSIPSVAYTTGTSDTLQSLTQQFSIGLDALAAPNATVPNLFDASIEPVIRIAHLHALFVTDFWPAFEQDNQIGQLAGMASRFMLHGLRLPATLDQSSVTLPPNFLYPAGQTEYGLYALTGQQFPFVLSSPSGYGITIGKDATLNWLEFDGSTSNDTLAVDLSDAAATLEEVLAAVQQTEYDPQPALSAEPDVTLVPRQVPIQSVTSWSTSDIDTLVSITTPGGDTSPASGPQPQATLWMLPDSLLMDAETRQAALNSLNPSLATVLPNLPVFQPQAGVTDPSTHMTTFTPLGNYAFATAIEISVAQISQFAQAAPQTATANSIVPPGNGNPGAPTVPLAPFIYQLLGPSPSDAILLERVLQAMASLGEPILSGIFLLYPTGSTTPGLISQGAADLLAFATQTNVSTETNPAALRRFSNAGAGQPVRGIANSPTDFLQLVWEVSSVNSGGYYLYYEIVGSGGLPPSLFNSSGTATLTLVITYSLSSAMQAANGGVLTNYVNAFVSTDAIDANTVMTLVSQSAPASTLTIPANATPKQLAKLYGVEPGVLATLNSGVTLTSGAAIPISGAFAFVTPAMAAGGNVLQTLATYYSNGAQTPITTDDIASFNPNVAPDPLAVLRIPPITYVVTDAAGSPGNTLSGISAYFGLSLDALSYLIRDVANLFDATQLATDSLEQSAQPLLGTANLGVELTVTPPPIVTSPPPAVAAGAMASLYSLLTAGLAQNAFFNASPQGLPFGPLQPVPSSPGAPLDLRRRAHRRRLALANDGSTTQTYTQAIGYSAFSTVNPAPSPSNPLLPDPSANPYAGVGTIAQVDLRWLDLFGNITVTPFSAPPVGYAGPFNLLPVPIDYVDSLIGLAAWPNVNATYLYEASPPGSPQLTITFALNTAAYDPSTSPEGSPPSWQTNAQKDLQTFTRIYFQLNQNYDDLGIPGLSGSAVSMSLHDTLLAEPDIDLTGDAAGAITAFVSECLIYVANRAQGDDGGPAPSCTVSLPVDIDAVSAENIIELSLSFKLERQAALADPGLQSLHGGLSAKSRIAPYTTAPSSPADSISSQTLDVFADAFEAAFATASWQLRLGLGPADPAQVQNDPFTVWAVRFGNESGTGITYGFASLPSTGATFWAPAPVASSLVTASAVLSVYETGKAYPVISSPPPPPVTFTAVDLNIWAANVLATIDAFLSPSLATPAFIVDTLTFADPDNDGYLAQILASKESLAATIAGTVTPIFAGSDPSGHQAAIDVLQQALLNQLSNATIVTAVIVVPVINASTNEPPEATQPRLYGQPLGRILDTALPTPNFSLSTGKISLPPAGGYGDSQLAFLFSSRNSELSSVGLGVSYAVTDLEHDIVSVPGIEDYEQSSWIHFVNGPFVAAIGPMNIPVVLRALPAPPTVSGQSGGPATNGMSAAGLALWDYSWDYFYRQSPQDSVTATVKLNLAQNTQAALVEDTDPFFTALAQFVSVAPAINADFQAYLGSVNAQSTATDTNVVNAQFALAAFAAIVANVASAWPAGSPGAVPEDESLTRVTCQFDIVLQPDQNDDAITTIENLTVSPPAATLPAPLVFIDPESYAPVRIETSPPSISYEYLALASPIASPISGPILSLPDALADPNRSVAFESLNVFQYQNAWASIQVLRNELLVQGQTTASPFLFRTPPVSFAAPLVPLLKYDTFDLGSVVSPTLALDGLLEAFFIELLRGGGGQTVSVSMTAAYSYVVNPSIGEATRISLPVTMLLPTSVSSIGSPPRELQFTDAVAMAVMEWLAITAPVIDRSSQINFQLSVFSGTGGSSLPLLTIANLYVSVESIE